MPKHDDGDTTKDRNSDALFHLANTGASVAADYHAPGTGPWIAAGMDALRPYLNRLLGLFWKKVDEGVDCAEEQGLLRKKDLFDDEEFLAYFDAATSVAIRVQKERNRQALVNTVLNTAIESRRLDADMRLIFLRHLDEFTEWHLRIFKFLADPEKVMTDAGTINKTGTIDSSGWSYLLLHFQKEMRDVYQRHLVGWIIEDLVRRGLIYRHNIDNTTNRQTLLSGFTTPLGGKFNKFIESPLVSRQDAP